MDIVKQFDKKKRMMIEIYRRPYRLITKVYTDMNGLLTWTPDPSIGSIYVNLICVPHTEISIMDVRVFQGTGEDIETENPSAYDGFMNNF